MNSKKFPKDLFLSQRIDTEPISRDSKFAVFMQTANRKKRSINRLTLQNELDVSMSKFRSSRKDFQLRKSSSNSSFLLTGNERYTTTNKNNNNNHKVNPFLVVQPLAENENELTKQKINLPEKLIEKINIEEENKILNKTKNNLLNLIDNLSKSKQELEKLNEQYNCAVKDLKSAKESRNKVMEEVYQMRNEVNYQRNTICTENFYTNNMNYNTNMTNKNSNNNIKNNLVEQIEFYEDKISKLKAENQNFLVDYDNLKEEYEKNLNQNKKLRNNINNLENNIKEAMKEKNNLKNAIEFINK